MAKCEENKRGINKDAAATTTTAAPVKQHPPNLFQRECMDTLSERFDFCIEHGDLDIEIEIYTESINWRLRYVATTNFYFHLYRVRCIFTEFEYYRLCAISIHSR